MTMTCAFSREDINGVLVGLLFMLMIFLYWRIQFLVKQRGAAPLSAVDERLFAQYAQFSNDILALFAFGSALAALSTKSPQFFAFCSLLFVILCWWIASRPFVLTFRRWNQQGHPAVTEWNIIVRLAPFIVGYGFLGAVFVGLLKEDSLACLFAR